MKGRGVIMLLGQNGVVDSTDVNWADVGESKSALRHDIESTLKRGVMCVMTAKDQERGSDSLGEGFSMGENI